MARAPPSSHSCRPPVWVPAALLLRACCRAPVDPSPPACAAVPAAAAVHTAPPAAHPQPCRSRVISLARSSHNTALFQTPIHSLSLPPSCPHPPSLCSVTLTPRRSLPAPLISAAARHLPCRLLHLVHMRHPHARLAVPPSHAVDAAAAWRARHRTQNSVVPQPSHWSPSGAPSNPISSPACIHGEWG